MARKERSKKRRKSRELNAVGKKRTTKAGISDQINNIRAGAGLSIAKAVSTLRS